MNYRIILTLSFALVLISSCQNKQKKTIKDDTSLREVSLRQEWTINSNFAGAVFAQNDFAQHYGLKLKIEEGSDQVDPVKLVLLGQDNFGDASADKVLVANDKGADLVIIGVISYNSPTCFIAKKEKKIYVPKDFENKTVGVLSGTNTEYIYRMLLKNNNINSDKIKEVDAPFDLNTFVVADAYDVRPAYIYDEPVSLDLQNIKYTVIEPKNYGIHFIGTVYFTTREYITTNPDIVQAFINSVADGWTAAIKYPKRAIELINQFHEIDTIREYASILKGLDYYRGKENKILWADESDWDEMVKSLIDMKVIKSFNYNKTIDNSFLEKYYSSNERR
jgi:ABC-type nitrate/sulfonate/bicarbonate transport system substrate-binding protein